MSACFKCKRRTRALRNKIGHHRTITLCTRCYDSWVPKRRKPNANLPKHLRPLY